MSGETREERVLEKAERSIRINRMGDGAVRVLRDGRPASGAEVRVEQIAHEFLFGCNIYMFDGFENRKDNEEYKKRFREMFNYATTGFYWRGYEPEDGQPRYSETDKIVAWCHRHGIRLKGHPLLWDHEAGRPRWAGDAQPPEERQRQRVQEIIRRYSGKIWAWEVVNEPSHCPGVKIDGPYRWAREADPKAYLIVNDFYVMADGHRPFFDLLKAAQARGVPFDGVGIQAHEPRTHRFPLDRVKRTLDKYATLGKDLHITEFTPTSGGHPITGSHVESFWDEDAQAEYASKFYTVCFSHPSVVAVTWWDLCDRASWLQGGGMLRTDMTPKPVYHAVRRLIGERWHTSLVGRTDSSGAFRFRGYHGKYRVEAEMGGNSAEAELIVSRGRAAPKLELEIGQ